MPFMVMTLVLEERRVSRMRVSVLMRMLGF